MDWSALDDQTAAGDGDNGKTKYVGMVDDGNNLGSNGTASTPDPLPPAEEGQAKVVQKMRPGRYLTYGKGMNKVMRQRPVAQHNGMPVYRTSPGQYVVAAPTARRRPRYPSYPSMPTRRVGEAMHGGMGSFWEEGSFWTGLVQEGRNWFGAVTEYQSEQAEREARLEQQRLAAEERAEEREYEREQAAREFEERLRREEELARQAAERMEREHRERMEAAARGETAVMPAGAPSWLVPLIAIGGLGLLGLVAVFLLKKDKEKEEE